MTELREVRLIGYPLAIWQSAQEHHEELMREFALLTLRSDAPDVPVRLITLVEQLVLRFSGISEEVNAEREAAFERGDESVDLVYHVPPEVREATVALERMLEEADEYCREGSRLLTLATPEPALGLRRWSLSEFVRQIDGLPPRPWPGVEAAVAIDVAATAPS